jgi:RNA polymerase sigma factor (TIGR02999 family)
MAPDTVRKLLERTRTGDPQATEELVPLVYDQLRSLASRYLRNERSDHTLRPTALVHEAYLRLAQSDLDFNDRVHFLAVAAGVMRRILVDHARSRGRQKRGDGAVRIPVDDADGLAQAALDIPLVTDIDDALNRLSTFDERKAKIIELVYFGGLTYDEVSKALDVSPVTVHRDLRLAKAWLRSQLQPS